ncbi:hypothetical protein RL73_00110 [Liberibacter crescens]|nr:hypothetical protein RL73_00110 [Liberibacter crescens]
MLSKTISKTEDWINWTEKQQSLASDPRRSVWVSANAGSGKTHVLAQRVIRLLLAKYKPSSLLCLTYTKEAASEMSNRVFEKLAEWTCLSDDELSKQIIKIEGKEPDKKKLIEARNLFIKALETPGGLKVQTIHAFCEAILQQFPLEANIAGHFSVIDDLSKQKIIQEAQQLMLSSIAKDTNSLLNKSFKRIIDLVDEKEITELISQIVTHRHALKSFFSFAAVNGGEEAVLRDRFGLEKQQDYTKLLSNLWPLPNFEYKEFVKLLREDNGIKALERAEILEKSALEIDPLQRFELIKRIFLTQELQPHKRIITKYIKEKAPHLEKTIKNLQEYIFTFCNHFNIAKMMEHTLLVLNFANNFIVKHEELKAKYSVLDFEDLIIRTAHLLKKSDVGAWIRYKLDQAIDHILIDEVQDTSPIQWEVIRALTEDFFSGENAHLRTLFAVGDRKQSIYSFQGARADRFSLESQITRSHVINSGQLFSTVQLPLSFRSTADILSAVDKVFSFKENAKGLATESKDIIHHSNRIGEPGTVDVWETIFSEKNPKQEDDWVSYFKHIPQNAPSVILAQRIADTILNMIENVTIINNGKKRLIVPGDILILVRKRNSFINCLTRILKNSNKIPVSGPDKLNLTDHIAVQDLIALGRVILSQEDDLSLASLLKSPLFSLSEDEIFELSAMRKTSESVFSHLNRLATAGHPVFIGVWDKLNSLIILSQSCSAYDFFSLTLGQKGGRKNFLARFGNEINDILDEFMNFALKKEQDGFITLQEFISIIEKEAPIIKRQHNQNFNEVRIMTVHASKGLEAPVVFLVDAGTKAFSKQHVKKLRLLTSDNNQNETSIPVWIPSSDFDNTVNSEDLNCLKNLEQEEYHRLLYVGMTRAADRLIICGYGSTKNNEGTWSDIVTKAFTGDERAKETTFYGLNETWKGLQWRTYCTEQVPFEDEIFKPKFEDTKKIPEELLIPPENQYILPYFINPSNIENIGPSPLIPRLFNEKPLNNYSLRRGRMIHKLLQIIFDIPEEDSKKYILSYCNYNTRLWPKKESEKLISSFIDIIKYPSIPSSIEYTSCAEVSIAGKISFKNRDFFVAGRVDRMFISEEKIFLLEYKTNHIFPKLQSEIPISHISQLSIYREVLKPLYPNKQFECLLIYTQEPKVFTLSNSQLENSLIQIENKFYYSS